MHPEAHSFVSSVPKDFNRVVEIGGRDVNGSVRPLFGDCDYTSVDVMDGPGVDVVADAEEWRPSRKADCVVCCEVLEHAANAKELVYAAADMLKKGGTFIVTAATDPRAPHSAVDGAELRDGEHYHNVSQNMLVAWFTNAGFKDWEVTAYEGHGDIYAVATK